MPKTHMRTYPENMCQVKNIPFDMLDAYFYINSQDEKEEEMKIYGIDFVEHTNTHPCAAIHVCIHCARKIFNGK